MKIVYFCPKCNGEDLKMENVSPKERIKRVSMDDMGLDFAPHTAPLWLRIKKTKVTCNDCGYSIIVYGEYYTITKPYEWT